MTVAADARQAVVAVDVGGTGIKAALCDRTGAALCDASSLPQERRAPTPVRSGDEPVLAAITTLISELRERAPAGTEVAGVGLIVPGEVDAAAGIARWSANIGWQDLEIRRLIGERTGLPVALEHDVRAAGLAEFRLGAARGYDEALFVAVGTGIAGAVVTNGRLVHGARYLAGELGHLPVFPDGEACACGQRGCAETYASAAALPRRYRQALEAGHAREDAGRDATGGTPSGAPGVEPDAPLDAERVIALAQAGDPTARTVLNEAVTALARMLLHTVLIVDPAVVVFGGGLSLAGAALLDPVAAALAGALVWRTAPPLRLARFGAQAGRVGAALVGWQAVDAAGSIPS